ncbi:unnamed protein product [Gongylonema pulchrum]|uniref:Eka-like protein n=1 Tax=Gongylonema pulchrum TaxID=637853 RepID=A0A183CZZ2_9BILA|nr:unnamed protein product [Gongylonema pulchrum]
MQQTINIRCNWNELGEIRHKLCDALRHVENRSQWNNLFFGIARHMNSLHFSIEGTVAPAPATPPPTPRAKRHAVVEEDKTPPTTSEATEEPKPKPETWLQKKVAILTVVEYIKETEQQTKNDAATQTDPVADEESKTLSEYSTVIFGPCPTAKDGARSVKCVQVGYGKIRQLK